MKRKINALIVLFLGASMLNLLIAQTDLQQGGMELKAMLLTDEIGGVGVTDISMNVREHFRKQFPGISGELWSKTENGFVVAFQTEGKRNWAFLDRKGNCTAQIHYYEEELLPKEVRGRIKSVYYDYSIGLVKEVSVGKDKVYMVTLEDKDSWKIIVVGEEEINVYKECKKG